MNHTKAWICTGAACLAFSAAAAAAIGKSDYEATKAKAEADYKASRSQCDSLTGNPKDICIAQAKAAKIHAESDAEAQLKNTPAALADARKDEAKADYEVSRLQCNSQTENAKDVCIKQAKATLTAAEAGAKADQKADEAHADAMSDKNSADYKVAREKCDAYAGPTKDACVADAKSQYGM